MNSAIKHKKTNQKVANSPRQNSKVTGVSKNKLLSSTLVFANLICGCVVKTEKLAENHFKRVTNFAKEMLVWPTEIDVHKIKN